MYRFVIVLALAGLLVACTTQSDGSSAGPLGSAGTSAAPASAGASGGGTGTTTAACEEAFGEVAALDVDSVSDLGDFPNEVQPTIEGCESVADWVAGAGQALGIEVNPNTAALLLDINCADPSLADTAICEELASS